MALWSGRFSKGADQLAAQFTASIDYDKRLYAHDIQGSIAHVTMLAKAGIIPKADATAIVRELRSIRQRIEAGTFKFRAELEDIHMNIEAALIEKLGDTGARVHTGRSRNDQVNTDVRLYLRDECDAIGALLAELQRAFVSLARANQDLILPGLTHLQNAQPVLLAHHLLAYVEMFDRDRDRLVDCQRRLNRCPLGAGALAGSTLPLDREFVARKLGFDGALRNSMDAVSDRDFIIEFLADLSIVAVHSSRLAEDLVLWVSQRFKYVELDDAFCTGSSLMPQKKNPDIAELVRGKAGRVVGSLVGLLTVVKGLPLTYNRDLQEDKEGLFDAIDTVKLTLALLAPMLRTATFNRQVMEDAASDPALMATDLAEWLVKQGVPFRQAHHQVGRFVAWCGQRKLALDQVTLEQMRETVPLAKAEALGLFNARRSVNARTTLGGTAPEQVAKQLKFWETRLRSKTPKPRRA
ncbi:MAG: argininosuccinate lyase [Lentisphaerae bacterium RIFOXYB12_FULL_65_16]|nr:MAG: argininosuccinate lyase [Lentisphaerae bacterium RIFOXYA12_64_32]OGV90544.1 MAG: argininosuccinate lyase [Lentisphaerae bacterium RIFOXYB12_FULL_65_16]